jgi:hypothetical protein
MTKYEAIEECHRYLAYLDWQRSKSLQMQALATMARNGKQKEAREALHRIDSSPVVYDGANLEKAIKKLLKCVSD